MKKELIIFICLCGLMFSNCQNSGNKKEAKEAVAEAYYPIGNYIRSQLLYIDSMPLAVIKYTTIEKNTDTSIADKKDFEAIANNFISPDIGDPELIRSQYQETSFLDASLGTITLTYLANNQEAAIKKADVLLNAENTRVKTVYIEKEFSNTDSSVIQKMLWGSNSYCQITSIIQKKGQPEKIVIEKYVWDF